MGLPSSIDYLHRLVAFPTVSRDSNLDLIAYARSELEAAGARCRLVESEDKRKANLFATLGPEDRAGVVLSGHTDVVPTEGQAWSSDPFRIRTAGGRLFGRGSADMKGFIASALRLFRLAERVPLGVPLHLALSYDEEVGCLGVRRLIAVMRDMPVRPRFCIVGEPTSLTVVTAHKGKVGRRVHCKGLEAHSSLAPLAVNAIHLACDLIGEIRRIQADIAATSRDDGDYEVPYTTLHAGNIAGGEVINIVPNACRFDYEIRYIPEDDPHAIVKQRFAGDLNLQRPPDTCLVEDTQNGDRIRGRDQRAEKQTVDKRYRLVEKWTKEVQHDPDKRGGKQHA